MKPIEITNTDFLAKVMDYRNNPENWKYLGDKPAIVDFYAPWCMPCKTISPILEELAKEYGDKIYIYKVNTEKEQELSAIFNIQSVPSIMFIPMEGMPSMARGAMPKTGFVQFINEILLANGKQQEKE